jgi:hypothetical protein
MGSILYAQSTGSQQTQSGVWAPIPGLQLTLPSNSGGLTNALITLNVPNPYASGNNFPGGTFGISVNGAVMGPYASFTYSSQVPQSFGRMPTTLIVQVKLVSDTQQVQAMWQSVRGSTVIIDSPATLSAIIDYFS